MRASQVLALAGVVGIVLAACDGGTAKTASSPHATAGMVRFPVTEDLTTLDPAQVTAKPDITISQNLFDGLLKFDNTLRIVPDIATKLPDVSADGKTYTFHLDPRATFWNGHPATAQDFIYSFSRAAAEGQNAYGVNFDHVAGYDAVASDSNWATDKKMLSGMSAPDAHTLVIKLVSPWSAFTTELAQPAAAQVVDPAIVNEDDAHWWASPATLVGTGPYRMVARTAKQSIDFAAVDHWWGGQPPAVKRIHIDVIGDATRVVSDYEQGRYDLVGYGGMDSDIPTSDVLRLQNNPKESGQVRLVTTASTIWVQFSFTRPESPFKDDLENGAGHDLRLALTLAIDRNQLVDLACAHGVICSAATGGVITKGLKGYAGDGTDPLARFDPVTARTLLQRADPTGARTAHLTYYFDTNKTIYRATAESLQSQWQINLGIHVTLQPIEHAAFFSRSTARVYVLFREGWQADYDHPQDWFDNVFLPSGGNNGGGFSDPKVSALVKRADMEPLDRAILDYIAASRQLETDAAYAPLVYLSGAFLVKPYVQGAGANAFYDYRWNALNVLST